MPGSKVGLACRIASLTLKPHRSASNHGLWANAHTEIAWTLVPRTSIKQKK